MRRLSRWKDSGWFKACLDAYTKAGGEGLTEANKRRLWYVQERRIRRFALRKSTKTLLCALSSRDHQKLVKKLEGDPRAALKGRERVVASYIVKFSRG